MTKILLVGAEPDSMPRLKLVYKSLKTLGHDVKVFAPFQRKGNSIMRYLANMVKLMFERAEAYHFFNIPDIIGVPLLFKRGRLVYDIRSPWKEVVMESTGNKFLAKIAGMIEKIFTIKADSVVTANPLLGTRAIQNGAKSFTNVPNFPYEEMSIDGWEMIDKIYRKNEPKQEALVMFFGKISIPEGSNVLADVIIKTLSIDYDLFNVRFLILGDGPELQNLIDKVADAGMLDRVHFLGWMPHKLIGKWIRAVDLCIMPREESGTMTWIHPDCVWKVNEATSIGTSVLATHYGGFNQQTVFFPLQVVKNENFPGAIINLLEAILRWGSPKTPAEDAKINENLKWFGEKPRGWRYCREQLAKVYGR